MKKAFTSKKLSKPSKILRRVLSKTSNTSNTTKPSASNSKSSINTNSGVEERMEKKEIKPAINVEAELLLLKQQIGNLQLAVNSMQNDTEKKEVAIANLAREKERLASDLRKQQRSYSTLKQQLDEEREFYYKEKEQYCQEMNDCKRLKKTLRHGDTHKSEIDYYKKEVSKLKESLTQTLEANYNLSVKFLRMKNTKYCIKNRLKKLEAVHENSIEEYNLQMEVLKRELMNIIDKELLYPIPPSNKKYLQILKQNGMLTHENLCLRLEVDRLNLELERFKMLQIRSDTNNKLKYINHKTRSCTSIECRERKHSTATVKEQKCVKINLETENEEQNKLRSESEHVKSPLQENSSRKNSNTSIKNILACQPETKNDDVTEDLSKTDSSKYEVIQLTDKPSQISTQLSDFSQTSCEAIRTQSAPEIVQTSLFVNDT